eukprot:2388552-Rhodomonas_salina.1
MRTTMVLVGNEVKELDSAYKPLLRLLDSTGKEFLSCGKLTRSSSSSSSSSSSLRDTIFTLLVLLCFRGAERLGMCSRKQAFLPPRDAAS